MKTWWNFEFGAPQARHGVVVTRFDAVAVFPGSGSFRATPTVRLLQQAIARFAGSATLSATPTPILRQVAIATFAGVGSLLATPTLRVRQAAIATFAGVGSMAANLTQIGRLQVIATFAGAGSCRATPNQKYTMIAQFGGLGGLNATPVINLQAVQSATATFAGVGSMAMNLSQIALAVAQFAGASTLRSTTQIRVRANARFAGAGLFIPLGVVLPGGAVSPNAPILASASAADDTTPDFNVTLPTGAGNATDAAVGDILVLESSINAGSTWQPYTNRTLVLADITTGTTATSSAVALATGSYLFRARLTRGAVNSANSTSVAVSIVVAPAAPSLTLLSVGTSDTTPDFRVNLPPITGGQSDAVAGDILLAEVSSDNGANFSASFSKTLVTADITAGNFNISSAQLATGTYLFHARLQRSTVFSPFSANVSVQVVAGTFTPTTMFVRSVANKGEVDAGGIDTFTKLMLHMDALDGSQQFFDSSASNHSMAASHGYRQTTLVQKFGPSSGAQNGFVDDYLINNETPAAPDFAFGTGDFTIDFWFFLTSTSQCTLYDSRPLSTEGFYPTIYINGSVIIFRTNSIDQIVGTTGIQTNVWHHAALARASTSTKLFLDGIQESSTFIDSSTYINGVFRPMIANNGFNPDTPVIGAMDEVRVSKGIARWTANFTPPTNPYSLTGAANNVRLRAQSNKGA